MAFAYPPGLFFANLPREQYAPRKITPEERSNLASGRPVDPEAGLEYLHGLYFENKSTESDLRTAIGHFEKAVAKDPAYAAAYAELAMTYFRLGRATNNGPSVNETGPPANTAVAKALQLDLLFRARI